MKIVKNKPTIIIFEGVDKSGKTSLKDEFNKRTNFSYIVLDRFTTSSKVYNDSFNRDKKNILYYDEVEKIMSEMFNVIVIYCCCDTHIIKERLIANNEVLPDELKFIDEIKYKFYNELKKSKYSHILYVDTSNDIDSCIEYIIENINVLV